MVGKQALIVRPIFGEQDTPAQPDRLVSEALGSDGADRHVESFLRSQGLYRERHREHHGRAKRASIPES